MFQGRHANKGLGFTKIGLVLALSVSWLRAETLSDPPPQITLQSIVRMTYESNLRIAAQKYNVEGAEYQFQRFERALSKFTPLIVESGADRQLTRDTVALSGAETIAKQARTSVGMEKEFFDGTRIGASTGMHSTDDVNGQAAMPFVGFDVRVPLFSSATKLERITARGFEEGEKLRAWLDFIATVRGSIGDSEHAYFDLQWAHNRQRIVQQVLADFQRLEAAPRMQGRSSDTNLIRDQLQSYQSELVNREGDMATIQLRLVSSLGLDEAPTGGVAPTDLYAEEFYGIHYLRQNQRELIQNALDTDVEIRVLETARGSEELTKQLALKGKWDILGHVFSTYDFDARGDDLKDHSGYSAGVALSVQRNDPRLRRLTLQRAEVSARKFKAQIDFRRRQIENDIEQRLTQARTSRKVIRELMASRTLRQGVYDQKCAAWLNGEETTDTLIQARSQLFKTENDLIDQLSGFYHVIVNLNQISGQYFTQLNDEMLDVRRGSGGNASVDSREEDGTSPRSEAVKASRLAANEKTKAKAWQP